MKNPPPLGYTKSRMNRVAIVSKPLKAELKRLLPELVEWLRAHNFEPVLDRESASYLASTVKRSEERRVGKECRP